ncbi:zincin-like metallopeptidase domain-containing protein [Sphingomonas sp. PWP1-2]|uniref:zincin-like metallopeptidase domain-containing protein n=1 Tax=Sphingomonas sp. PWP1-2 TaxID=2804558 RepID=UPI003CF94141
MAHALAYRPVTGPDDPFDRINDQVLALMERGQVPWATPWRLVVTPGHGSCNEDGSGIKLCHYDPSLPARLVAATNPTAPRDVDAEFHELFAATGINFRLGAIRTFYSLSEDMIALSDWRISDPTEFLRDWIHELLHAVGHSSRLDRKLPRGFGSNAHGMEDLIAEIGAALVCASLGIEPSLRHPACLDTWIELLRSDNEIFEHAVRSADAAAGYLFARRDAQAAAFDRLEAEEAAAEREEAARKAAVRRRKWRCERERWAFGSVTGSRPGESLLAAHPGDLT